MSRGAAAAVLSNIGKYSDESSRNLALALRTNWLLHPISLFNKSRTPVDSRRYSGADTPENFVVDFGRFVDVIEPETVRLLTAALRAR